MSPKRVKQTKRGRPPVPPAQRRLRARVEDADEAEELPQVEVASGSSEVPLFERSDAWAALDPDMKLASLKKTWARRQELFGGFN